MATVALGLVKTMVRGFLPDGSFWNQEGVHKVAADRFVTGLATALRGSGAILGTEDNPGIVDFMCQLDVFIDPARTPHRSILLQYYEYFQIATCTPIPDDLEDLRAIVVQANNARPVYTPRGLRSWINGQLPLVEVSESLPLTALPFEVPRVADGYWAVVEIWYSPLINPAETVLCVSRPVSPGSNDIRLVQPQVLWALGVPAGPSIVASEVALLWAEQRTNSSISLERFNAAMVLQESVVLPSVQKSDVMTGDQMFPLLTPTTVVATQIWRVTQVTRQFILFGPFLQTMGITDVTLP